MTQPGPAGVPAAGPPRARPSFLAQRSAASAGRLLRPSSKVLPEHARGHNRALVLQTLFSTGQQSRADVARSTGLTRVTVSELVTELMADGILVETGQREGTRPGKPAILLDIDRGSFQIIGIDLSDLTVFRGAVLDLGGTVLRRAEVSLAGSTGQAAIAHAVSLAERLLALVSAPLLGIGVGSPGVVDLDGVVVSAPNLEWAQVPLREVLSERFGVPVVVANDANAAVLAEHSFGDATGDLMLVRIGRGVGAGLLLGGSPVYGSRFAAGEIGHVVVGADDGELCSCGKRGCLETWIAVPRLEAKLDAGGDDRRPDIVREAGARLGVVLAPIVGALDLAEVVISGPAGVLGGAFVDSARETITGRTMAQLPGESALRMSTLGEDIVLRGTAVMVISARLGVA
jgi:predicted NBD/HSP70 family sugar kinase/biotin operon repressor